ncbi:HTH cro/C1-type domain-containing protein [Acetobacteraceae bacterium EV16G]|uniref:HTH cro/C1-type domain-containing protein n=1 Tax=Sorlinia euscelidii TaxID=3081148 RepID=A0ABU7U0X8_9PROT
MNQKLKRLSRYDSADYLDGEDDIAAYLNAAADSDDGDGATIISALAAIARARGTSALAREVGITRQGLSKALSQGGNPTLATVTKIAKALNVRLGVRSDAALPSSPD